MRPEHTLQKYQTSPTRRACTLTLANNNMKIAIPILLCITLCCCKKPHADYETAISFVHETHERSHKITSDGEVTTSLLMDLIQDKSDTSAELEKNLVDYENRMKVQIDDYRSRTLPEFEAIQSYRDIVIEYFEWGRTAPIEFIRLAIPIALDRKLSSKAREKKIASLMEPLAKQQQLYSERVDAATDAVWERVKQ